MAKRTKKPLHLDSAREKIQTSQLVNRLQDHAFEKITLDKSRVKAIEVLLKKTLPDLQSIQMDTSGEVTVTVKQFVLPDDKH